jgi:hypothetical protein
VLALSLACDIRWRFTFSIGLCGLCTTDVLLLEHPWRCVLVAMTIDYVFKWECGLRDSYSHGCTLMIFRLSFPCSDTSKPDVKNVSETLRKF